MRHCLIALVLKTVLLKIAFLVTVVTLHRSPNEYSLMQLAIAGTLDSIIYFSFLFYLFFLLKSVGNPYQVEQARIHERTLNSMIYFSFMFYLYFTLSPMLR